MLKVNEMKTVNFKKMYAENFMCFGPEGILIDFENYNNIVLIKGKNLDTIENTIITEKHSSNGAGKSSIPAILVYGLYGKTIRKPNKISHKDVINQTTGKKLKVEVYWDNYKLQRTRKPDGLKLWKSDESKWDESTEITLGGMPATQELIENIIGMTYETFINVAIFTDDNTSSFLECDAADKREIVENLLSLEKYRNYHENAKKILKAHKESIAIINREIAYIDKSKTDEESNLQRLEKSQTDWVENKKTELENLKKAIGLLEQEKKKALEDDTEAKKYEEVLEKISVLEKNIIDINDSIETLEKNETVMIELQGKITPAVEKQTTICNEIKIEIKELDSTINKININIQKIEKLEDGVQCSYCLSVVDKKSHDHVLENFTQELQSTQENKALLDEKLINEKNSFDLLSTKLQGVNQKLTAIKDALKKQNQNKSLMTKELNDLLKIQKPVENQKLNAINQKIAIVKSQIENKIKECSLGSPYASLIETSKNNIETIKSQKETKEKEFSDLNEKTKYFEYWITAFGDSGIRKYVIDEIVPALNSNINYWLQFLIENKISLKFNNEFEETIEKYPTDGKTYHYETMSNGQRRRINLALSQAFAHVMSLNSGKTPNVVFLDEVTSNVDPQGVAGIYNMICELNKEKQVFITTHDHDLIEFLNGCDTLDLVMKKGMTKLEK